MEIKCPVCATDVKQAALLGEVVLYKCPNCHWLMSPEINNPVDKANPSVTKNDEYLAIVQKSSSYVALAKNDRVLDINCSDGSLLGWYLKDTITVGNEPNAKALKEALNHKRIDIAVPEEFSAKAIKSPSKSSFKIITAIDVFQNMHPRMMRDCADLLDPNGVLVIQVPYFHQLFTSDLKDFVFAQNYLLTYTLKYAVTEVGLFIQGMEFTKKAMRAYITHPAFKAFAASELSDKLHLYTTMNAAFMTDIQARYDKVDTFQFLESRFNSKRVQRRNSMTAPNPQPTENNAT